MYSRWRHPPKTVSPRPYCRSRRGRNGLSSETISEDAIFMPNMIKTHQLEHVFFNFSGSVTDSKSVARCVAIIIIFIINNGTFLGLNLIKIIHQNLPDCINHFKIFAGSISPNPLASL